MTPERLKEIKKYASRSETDELIDELERLEAVIAALKEPHACGECEWYTFGHCRNMDTGVDVVHLQQEWLCGHWQKKGTQ